MPPGPSDELRPSMIRGVLTPRSRLSREQRHLESMCIRLARAEQLVGLSTGHPAAREHQCPSESAVEAGPLPRSERGSSSWESLRKRAPALATGGQHGR